METRCMPDIDHGTCFAPGVGYAVAVHPCPAALDVLQTDRLEASAIKPDSLTVPKPAEGGLKIVRPLSQTERKSWLAAQTVPVNFAMMARIRGKFSGQQIRNAIAELQKHHALLAVRVVDRGDRAYFCSDGVPPPQVAEIQNCGDEDLSEIVTQDLLRSFPAETGPLVRFLLLRCREWSDLVVVCHHGVFDALSAAYLIRDILCRLADPTIPVTPLPAGRPFTSLIPLTTRKRFRFWFTVSAATFFFRAVHYLHQKPRSHRRGAAQAMGHGKHQDVSQPVQFISWSIPEAHSHDLMERSGKEQTTIEIAISCAFLKSFASNDPGSLARRISSPLNLRNRLSEPVDDTLGLYEAPVETSVHCSTTRGFWETARELQRKLTCATTDEKLFRKLIVDEIRLQDDAESRSPGQIPGSKMQAKCDFSVAHLGRLDFPSKSGSLTLDSLFGPAVGWSHVERVLGVTRVGGRIFLTFAFQPASLDPAVAERIKKRAMCYLASAIRV